MLAIESIDREIPSFLNSDAIESWFSSIIQSYDLELGEVTVIFCSDEHLIEMNKQYLDHDYYTDIITFDYSESGIVSGDLFISLDRVKENAKDLSQSFSKEVLRVMIHGVLHLCGLVDKGDAAEKEMRAAEDKALTVAPSL